MRQASLAEFGAVVARFRVRRRIDIGAALLLLGRHADKQLVDQPERPDDPLADYLAIIAPGDRLDDHGQGQMRAAAVILKLRSGRPFRLKFAHLGAHPGVVGPAVAADIGARKACLVGRQLKQRDLFFSVRGEFRDVVGDAVMERQGAILDEAPHRGRRQHLGVGEQQP